MYKCLHLYNIYIYIYYIYTIMPMFIGMDLTRSFHPILNEYVSNIICLSFSLSLSLSSCKIVFVGIFSINMSFLSSVIFFFFFINKPRSEYWESEERCSDKTDCHLSLDTVRGISVCVCVCVVVS